MCRRLRRRCPSSSSCAWPPSSSEMWCTWQNVPVWWMSLSFTEALLLLWFDPAIPEVLSAEAAASCSSLSSADSPLSELALTPSLLLIPEGQPGEGDSDPSVFSMPSRPDPAEVETLRKAPTYACPLHVH